MIVVSSKVLWKTSLETFCFLSMFSEKLLNVYRLEESKNMDTQLKDVAARIKELRTIGLTEAEMAVKTEITEEL